MLVTVGLYSAAFRSGSGRLVLDVLGCCAIVMAASVARARYRTMPTRASELLVVALGLQAAISTILVMLAVIPGFSPDAALNGALTIAAPLGAGLLAWAALAPATAAEPGARPGRLLVSFASMCVGTLAIGALAGGLWPGRGLDAISAIGVHQFAGETVAPGSIELVTTALLAVAAAGFANRAARAAKWGLEWWLALSAGLAAGAHFAHLILPAQVLSVSAGDFLYAAAMIALVLGATREFGESQRRELDAAVVAERKRIGRELHDSVASELAYILGQSRELVRLHPDERVFADITSAAAHALEGSRAAIYELQSPSPQNLAQSLQARAHELAGRAGLELTLDIPTEIRTSTEIEHGVLSILQEAIANAARHSGAKRLDIALRERRDSIVVRISDDGAGFESVTVPPSRTGGFGLAGMRERAQALGGSLKLESTPGRGTTIELEVR